VQVTSAIPGGYHVRIEDPSQHLVAAPDKHIRVKLDCGRLQKPTE